MTILKTTLCHTWKIPTYARPYIRITSEHDIGLPIDGESGEFELTDTPTILTICWGDAPLAQLHWQSQSLNWQGTVNVGGFVTAIHVTQLPAIDLPLAIITLEAYPLKPEVMPYLSARSRANLPYNPPDFLNGIDDEIPEGVTTWIAEVDSPLVGLLQDAMNQGNRIYAFGQLASDNQVWHKFFALPILLESVTTFMR